jgi:UDP-MurNAc hydroxylase
MNKDTTVILPGFPTREMERTFSRLGFRKFVRTADGTETEIADGVRVAVHVETSITDGPGGDSALVVSDGTSRLVNQNDCRTNDLTALRAHGPVDLHWLQFSGAIWYPMVYEMDETEKKQLCVDKVESQFSRAMRYVESIDATTVVPSAGPPCFLDGDLFGLNMITGDETSIFPDQREFIRRLADAGRPNASLTVPGTSFTVVADPHGGPGVVTVEQPQGAASPAAIFADKAAYLRAYQADKAGVIAAAKAGWAARRTDLVDTLRTWFEPLMAMAPNVRRGIGTGCLIVADDVSIYLDFPNGKVAAYTGNVPTGSQPYGFRFRIPRDLLESVVAERAVDWSNSLFLSARFSAWREGEYNEHLYNFLKSLSVERMARTESEAATKASGVQSDEADIECGGYLVQRRCPHRNADLAVFGEIDGEDFVCTLHGWRFSLADGTCRNAAEHSLRIAKRP